MGAYDSIRTDTALEQKGVIIDYTDYRITIARAGGSNKRFQKALEKISAPFERAIVAQSLSNSQSEELLNY